MKINIILVMIALSIGAMHASYAKTVNCMKPTNYQEGLQQAQVLAGELAQAMLLGGLNGELKCEREYLQLKQVALSNHLEDDINHSTPYPRTIRRDQLLNIDIQESFGRNSKGQPLTSSEKNQARELRFQENAYPMWITLQIKGQKPFQFEAVMHLSAPYSEDYRCGYTSSWFNRFINYQQCID